MNDSILVQSYIEAYDISYPEALRRIESEVSELQEVLNEQGSYELEDLGTLTVNQEGNYEFTPCEAGVLSPDLYGLSDFTFKRLKDADEVEGTTENAALAPQPAAAREVALQPSLLEFTDSEDDGRNDKTITIKMSWLRNAVAVAAAVLAFFFISTPVANSDLDTPSMSLMQNDLLYKLIPQDTNIVPAEPVAEPIVDTTRYTIEEPVAAKPTPESQPVAQTKEVHEQKADNTVAHVNNANAVSTPTAKTTYYVIVASQVKRSNAELLVNKLQQQGFKDAKIFVRNNTLRVSCGEFATQAEAYRLLNKINSKEDFYEAWVFKDKASV